MTSVAVDLGRSGQDSRRRCIGAGRTAPTGKLDSIASANLARDRSVDAVVGIVKGADTLFLAPYGKANVESDAPVRTDANLKGFMANVAVRLRWPRAN